MLEETQASQQAPQGLSASLQVLPCHQLHKWKLYHYAKDSQEYNPLNGVTQQVSNTVVSDQDTHVMGWCRGGGEPGRQSRAWDYHLLMEPVQIPAFPAFVPAH